MELVTTEDSDVLRASFALSYDTAELRELDPRQVIMTEVVGNQTRDTLTYLTNLPCTFTGSTHDQSGEKYCAKSVPAKLLFAGQYHELMTKSTPKNLPLMAKGISAERWTRLVAEYPGLEQVAAPDTLGGMSIADLHETSISILDLPPGNRVTTITRQLNIAGQLERLAVGSAFLKAMRKRSERLRFMQDNTIDTSTVTPLINERVRRGVYGVSDETERHTGALLPHNLAIPLALILAQIEGRHNAYMPYDDKTSIVQRRLREARDLLSITMTNLFRDVRPMTLTMIPISGLSKASGQPSETISQYDLLAADEQPTLPLFEGTITAA